MSYRRICAYLLTAVIACGCATAYQPQGATGGFSELRIDDSTYRVLFSGNGNTSADTVWNYWIYRCAELTISRGYDVFIVEVDKTPANTQVNSAAFGASRSDDRGGEEEARVQYATHSAAPSYVYVPSGGGQVTRYTAHGTVHMYHSNANSMPGDGLKADLILRSLKPYVVSGGKTTVPGRIEILQAAAYHPAKKNTSGVTLEDLRYLLPKE